MNSFFVYFTVWSAHFSLFLRGHWLKQKPTEHASRDFQSCDGGGFPCEYAALFISLIELSNLHFILYVEFPSRKKKKYEEGTSIYVSLGDGDLLGLSSLQSLLDRVLRSGKSLSFLSPSFCQKEAGNDCNKSAKIRGLTFTLPPSSQDTANVGRWGFQSRIFYFSSYLWSLIYPLKT